MLNYFIVASLTVQVAALTILLVVSVFLYLRLRDVGGIDRDLHAALVVMFAFCLLAAIAEYLALDKPGELGTDILVGLVYLLDVPVSALFCCLVAHFVISQCSLGRVGTLATDVTVVLAVVAYAACAVALGPAAVGLDGIPRLVAYARLFHVIYLYFFGMALFYVARYRRYLGRGRSNMAMLLTTTLLLSEGLQLAFMQVLFINLILVVLVVLAAVYFYSIDTTNDQLTGILGEEGFYRVAAEFLRDHPDGDFYVVRYNVRNFQEINRRFGHEMGNRLLRRLASNTTKMVGDGGVCGRVSADNFICCIPAISLPDFPLQIDLGRYVGDEGVSYGFSLYMGVYRIEDRSVPLEEMGDAANYAMRQIHESYLVQHSFFTAEMGRRVVEECEMENRMVGALDDGEFHVWYQPIFDPSSGAVVSAEALVRWEDPRAGLILPGRFVPLFERNGFITRLDAYVADRTFDDIADWRARGVAMVPISLNMSQRDLTSERCVREMSERARSRGLDPAGIGLEVTESALANSREQLVRIVAALRGEGFHVLLDDFGSGYSSFDSLRDLPVDILKTDMKFAEMLEESDRGKIILASIVEMAGRMRLPVIVEGAETAEQVDYLRRLGCGMVQGYYFSKPLGRGDFEKLVRSSASRASRARSRAVTRPARR